MRRFMRTFNIFGRKVFVHLVTYEDWDMYTAMCSGIAFKEPQFLFLDYDKNKEPKEWSWIVKEYDLRRALVVESSPDKYWFISFTPLPIGDIAEIMFHSKTDRSHNQNLLKEGFVGIRLSKKKKFVGYPKVLKHIVNKNGKNFYNWDNERMFRAMLKGKVNFK
jgi:hypothetical protein